MPRAPPEMSTRLASWPPFMLSVILGADSRAAACQVCEWLSSAVHERSLGEAPGVHCCNFRITMMPLCSHRGNWLFCVTRYLIDLSGRYFLIIPVIRY